MGDIGPHETTTSFEIAYDRPNGPPIEIDVEISGICYCDDPEWGVEARDITARIVGRELDDDEIEYLGLEQALTENCYESQPCSPRSGEFYKGSDGYIWRVVDVCLTWGERRDRFVLLERPRVWSELERSLRSDNKIRRVVPLAGFDQGVDMEGNPLFQWTRNEPVKRGQLRAPGDSE